MVEVQCVPVQGWHADHLATHMRDADARECMALGGLLPRAALEQSLACDGPRWTALMDGEPAAIFGVVPVTAMGGGGVIWLLGTPLLLTHWRTFARLSKPLLRELLARYDSLINVVHVDNCAAIRWLEWVGARIVRQPPRCFFELRQT